jgi:hypothetical protein
MLIGSAIRQQSRDRQLLLSFWSDVGENETEVEGSETMLARQVAKPECYGKPDEFHPQGHP